MRRMLLYSVLILILLYFNSCATLKQLISQPEEKFDPDKPLPQFEFQPEEVYVLDTSSIPTTEPPNFIFLVQDKKTGLFRLAKENEKPDYAALDVNELKKLEIYTVEKNTYKAIAVEQATIINVQKKKIEALQKLLQLEREALNREKELRIAAEESYQKEKRARKIDNIVNRGLLVVVVVGSVALVAL